MDDGFSCCHYLVICCRSTSLSYGSWRYSSSIGEGIYFDLTSLLWGWLVEAGDVLGMLQDLFSPLEVGSRFDLHLDRIGGGKICCHFVCLKDFMIHLLSWLFLCGLRFFWIHLHMSGRLRWLDPLLLGRDFGEILKEVTIVMVVVVNGIWLKSIGFSK